MNPLVQTVAPQKQNKNLDYGRRVGELRPGSPVPTLDYWVVRTKCNEMNNVHNEVGT